MTLDRDALARPRVLLDCDGVLCDFIGGVLDIVETVTGERRHREEIDRFDFAAALGLTDEQREMVFRSISSTVNFCKQLRPHYAARFGVANLQARADIHIVTSPWNSSPTWTYERERWLSDLFGIHHRDITHTSAKHLIVGDWFIDDKTETCAKWQAAHPTGVAVQWITPHNRKDGWTGRATNSWGELCSWVAP